MIRRTLPRSRPDKGRTPRHGSSRRRWQGVLLQGVVAVLAGLGLGAGTLALTLVVIPDARAEERAFAAAAPCTAPLPAGVAVAREECLRELDFTVRNVSITRGKSSRYAASLTREAADGGGRAWERVEFGGEEPLLGRLERGDRVTATVWRGTVVEAAAHGTSQRTKGHPQGAMGDTTLIAAATALGTPAALAYGWWALTRCRTIAAGHRARGLSPEGWAATGVAALAPFSLVAAAALERPAWWTTPLWAAAAVGVALLWRRRAARRRPHSSPRPWEAA
ncbi:hypothetical protein [Streptomyces sp. TRM64462]|uniref:hypothetical protein n=1 Tax=Streptomyces sp. TRM64462 TaxID=2741726 RepID=UPI001586645C|nr:hypothetical protein [Streptomyces sp. TRM64462]